MGNRLAQLRAERGWKKARFLHELRMAARRRGTTLPKDDSLRRRVAVWENQDGAVGEFYRTLLCEVYGVSAAELGLTEGLAASEPAPLREEPLHRLTVERLDPGLVALLRAQTQNLRLLDRRLGAATLFRQATAHVEQLEQLVRQALPNVHRDEAADELGQAAALAGWQALDMGKLHEAWQFHETAKAAARESGRTSGLSYAWAQQGFILLDAGRTYDAHEMINAARAHAGSVVPPTLSAWLHAAEAEALASLDERDAALRALDKADAALPADAGDPELPYVMLSAAHLARWRGNCLARLGEESAIDSLTTALEGINGGQFGRAEASLRVDLALAFRARGDVSESRTHARRAAEVAGRTGSQRQRRRIAELLSG